jgi:hypothetical protein
VGSVAGAAWAVGAAVVLLLIGGWLDLLWELSPVVRIAIVGAAVFATLLFFGGWLLRVARDARYALLARRVDRAMGFGGEVLTGWELEDAADYAVPSAEAAHRAMTADMARMAVEHAARRAGAAALERVVPAKPAWRSAIFLAILAVAVALLAVVMPSLARTQWNRFASPYSDVPPFSKLTIAIEPPADKQVMYGESLDVRATIVGEPVDAAELVLEDASGRIETLPMFPEGDSHWRASLAKVAASASYYVRSYRARSEKHSIEVITVPKIENVKFRITPPAYANRPAYEGPLPKEGVAGLPGAKVQVCATSNRPLSGGVLTITMRSTGSAGAKAEENAVTKVTLKPTAADSVEVAGEFAVAGDGKFELYVVDVDETPSRQRFSGGITLLSDERPTIRIIQPPEKSLATPTAVLPTVLSAEDDYGISRVELFRSLNESRPLPADVPLPKRPPRRFGEKVELPLSAYGLKPGDIIKLFGRAEDNDPAGAKGAESQVATVEIISQEEFERMVLAKNGMEVMLSRYREAQRRLKEAAEQLEQLRKKLDAAKPGDPVNEETKSELKQLAKRLKDDAAAMRNLNDHKLPYEMDQRLSAELGKAANLPDEAAEAIEKLLKDADLHNEALKRQLGEMGKKLAQERQAFDQSAMMPMERLAAIVPLAIDQNRFLMIVLHQKDLAERLASLKGRDREDNPGLKARMRELEAEQRSVREALAALLTDIEEHAKKLPDEEHLAKLRETALQFAADVRDSGASTAMSEAEAGLAEYSGTIGYAKAKEAAEILEKFIKKCNGMGQACEEGMNDPIFQPGMGNCMKLTLEQMLGEMGLGSGSGSGGFMGAGSGAGSQRGFGPNIGLFGGLPGIDQPMEMGGRGQGNPNDEGKGGSLGGANPDLNPSYEASAEGTVGGASEGAIPLRYRRQVGKYFQRVSEETQEK